jgi:hypothetical protein
MGTNASGTTTKGGLAFARRDWLTFGRVDHLGAQIVLGIAVAGSVVFGLAAPVLDAVSNAPLSVAYTSKVATGAELPKGTTIDGSATVQLLLRDATSVERLTQAIPAFLVAGLTIAIAFLLFRLLRSTQAGEPFTRRNVSRINGIALLVGVGGMVVQLAGGIADNAIQTSGRLSRPDTLTFAFTPLPLAVMIVIALVGEAFRRGVLLREDVEGLV